MKKIELSEHLLNDVAAYLARQPYIEVADLLRRLQSEAQEAVQQREGKGPE